MKKPTLSSILILAVFVIVVKFDFDYSNMDVICYRKSYGEVNWKMINPILIILLIGSCTELYLAYKESKTDYLSALFVAPVLLMFFYWVAKLVFNAVMY